jgi:large conductance mechanosensitive channel
MEGYFMKKLKDAAASIKGSSNSISAGFIAFLKNYGIIGLAIAVIIGAAVGKLVSSLVADIIMPIVTFFIPGGNWREATLNLGPIILKVGSFIGNIIDFVIVALVVYLMAKWILKEETVTKK